MGQQNINLPSNDSSGTGAGMILGIVLAVVVIGFLVWYFLLKQGGGGTPTPSGSGAPLPSLGGGSVAPSALLSQFLAWA